MNNNPSRFTGLLYIFLPLMVFMMALSGCAGNPPDLQVNSAPEKETTPVANLAVTASVTNVPTELPTPTVTPTSTAIPFPFLRGTTVPTPDKPLSNATDANLIDLADWGKGAINDVAISPDRNLLAVASTTGLYLYDPNTLQEKAHPDYEGLPAYSLLFSSDGKKLAVKFGREAISVYLVPDQKWITVSPPDKNSSLTSDPKENFTFSTDGQTLYISKKKALAFIDSSTGDIIKRISLPKGETYTPILVSADGKTLYLFEWDSIHLINMLNNTETSTIPLDKMRDYIQSPDGRFVVVVNVPNYSDQNTQLLVIDSNSSKVIHKIVKNQFGNTGGGLYFKTKLTISPDSKTLAVSYSPGPLCLWNLEENRSLGCLPGVNTASESEIAFSPDGQSIFFCREDYVIVQWNIADNNMLEQSSPNNTHQVKYILPSGQSSVIVVRSGSDFDPYSQTISLIASEQRQEAFIETDNPVRDIRFSMDGKAIFTVEDNAVKLWNLQDGKLEASISEDALLVKPSLDGSIVAIANRDNTIHLYTMPDAENLFTLSGHTNSVNGMFFLPGKDALVTTSKAETIVWDTFKGTRLFTLPETTAILQVMPTGSGFATVDRDMTINIWDLQKQVLVTTYESQDDNVKDILASEYAGVTLAVLGEGIIDLTNMQSGVSQEPISVEGLQTTRVGMDNGGRHVIVSTMDGLVVFDITTGKQVNSLSGAVDQFDVSSYDGRLATTLGNRIQIWSPVGNAPVMTQSDFSDKDYYRFLAYISDTRNTQLDDKIKNSVSSALLTGSMGFQQIIDPRNGNLIGVSKIPQEISLISYSPDSKLMGYGGNENTRPTFKINSFESETEKDLIFNPPHQSRNNMVVSVTSLSISNTGLIVSAVDDSDDSFVDIWDLQSSSPLATLPGNMAAISADGRQLVIVEQKEEEETPVMYDLSDPTNPQIKQEISLSEIPGISDINAVVFSPDGSQLALGDRSGNILLIDTKTASLLARVSSLTDVISGMVYSTDGRELFSLTSDGVIRAWGTGEDKLERTEAKPTESTNSDQVQQRSKMPDEELLEVVSPENIDRLSEVSVWEANPCPTEGEYTNCSTHLVSINGKSRILPTTYDDTVFYLNGSGQGSKKYIIDPRSDNPVQTYSPPNDMFYNEITISPDGHMLVSLDLISKTIYLQDDTGALLFELEGHTLQYLMTAAFSPDGRYLVTGFTDNHIHSEVFVWDTQTGKLTGKLQDTSLISTLTFLPGEESDAYTLLSGYLFNIDYPDSFRTYSIDAKGQIYKKRQKKITEYGLENLAVSPDGRLMVVGEYSSFIYIMSPDGKTKYLEIDVRADKQETGFAFLPSGKGLLISRGDGTVALLGVLK